MVTNANENDHGEPLRILRVAVGGDGIARERSGRTVFVPGTCPGDLVSVEFTQEKKRFARARVVELLESGEERVGGPCVHADTCGGCVWQHFSPKGQQAALEASLRFGFRNLTGEGTVFAPLRFGNGQGYRTRLRLHCVWRGPLFHLGFYRKDGNGLVEVTDCFVADPLLNERLGELRDVLKREVVGEKGKGTVLFSVDGRGHRFLSLRGGWKGEVVASLLDLGMDGVRLVAGEKERWGGETHGLWPVLGSDRELRIRNGDFAQSNPSVLSLLVEDLLGEIRGAKPQAVVELFCGSGTLTLPALEEGVTSWHAVEGAGSALSSLRETLAGDERVRLHEARNPGMVNAQIMGKPDLVVLDPPREGAKEWMRAIARLSAETIVYVSCDFTTQVRDLTQLVSAGYGLVRIIPYDMFPFTGHLETMVVLRRKDTSEAE